MPQRRGRAACNACRSRKQKCDENKPTCSRCREVNRPCEWPKLQKRGPAKGYLEALEHRLAETEAALARLLSTCSDQAVTSAFQRSDAEYGGREFVAEEVPVGGRPETSKADLVAYWEEHPLRTAQGVRDWAAAHVGLASHGASNSGGAMASELARSGNPEADDARLYPGLQAGAVHGQDPFEAMQVDPLGQDEDGEGFEVSQQFRQQFLW